MEEHGDDPVQLKDLWLVFDAFPQVTWRQDAVWRRQAARAFDDLTGDIEVGDWPQPRCPGEEMALHLMLRTAEAGVADGWLGLDGLVPRLPVLENDLDWRLLGEVLFQDHDVLNL